MISCMGQISHINLLLCVPVRAEELKSSQKTVLEL